MEIPTVGRIVIYTDNTGRRHAAIVAVDPEPGAEQIELVVFAFAGTAAYPIYAMHGEGKGRWSWPMRTDNRLPVDPALASA